MSTSPVTVTPEFGVGLLMQKIITLNGPTSYTTGGNSVVASAFGFANLALVLCEEQDSTGTYYVQIRQVAGPASSSVTWQWFAVGGSEVSALTNLSTYTIRLIGYGN